MKTNDSARATGSRECSCSENGQLQGLAQPEYGTRPGQKAQQV